MANKCIEMFSAPLIIREMHINAKIALQPTRMMFSYVYWHKEIFSFSMVKLPSFIVWSPEQLWHGLEASPQAKIFFCNVLFFPNGYMILS